jgi:hypothetical protein
MHAIAEELVANGGPSAPAWAFFTAITLGVLTLIGQQLNLRLETRKARNEASKAAESASQAQANTTNVSNGFVGRMDTKLDQIILAQRETDQALREHLRWHLERSE